MTGITPVPPTSTVDFLTVTTTEAKASASMMMTLMAVVGIEFITHEKKRPWSFMGFHGQAYEGLRYGIKDDWAIAMLSGPTAARLWHLIAPLRTKCTRIDLAVTVTLPSPAINLVATGYTDVLDNGTVQCTQIFNSLGGTTLYIGSRTSQWFGRLYDKGAEQGTEPGRCWRYEVECKKPASEFTVSRLLMAEQPTSFISSMVYNWFRRHGVVPVFDPENVDSAIEIEATVRSDDRSLEWLSSQVRPTVGRLIVNGKEREVLEALGLPEYTKPQLDIT